MNILISRCLLGFPCRYDGSAFKKDSLLELIDTYKNVHNFIAVCPEVESGLEVPRSPCEIVGDKVLSENGEDFTNYFSKGARIACNKAKANNVKLAILKSNSPSCGINSIYDGTFSGNIIKGRGISAGALTQLGVLVVCENDLDLINDYLKLNIIN